MRTKAAPQCVVCGASCFSDYYHFRNKTGFWLCGAHGRAFIAWRRLERGRTVEDYVEVNKGWHS